MLKFCYPCDIRSHLRGGFRERPGFPFPRGPLIYVVVAFLVLSADFVLLGYPYMYDQFPCWIFYLIILLRTQ